MTQTTISVGIIGTGFGKMIGLNFKAVAPSVKIYFAGRNQEKLKAVAEEVKADGVFNTWQELVQDPKIDLVVIASPSSAHKEMFELAAKAGKNILVEKPAALSSAEVAAMNKYFNEQNPDGKKFAVVNHEGRLNPVISYLKALIMTGKLGDILTVRIGAYLNWYSDPEYKENWNNAKDLGGGQIFSIGTHQMDLANYLLDFPEIKSGAVQDLIYPDPRFSKTPTSDSQFVAHFLTKKGTSVQLFNDCYCFGYKDFLIEVFGSKGIVIYSDQRGLKQSFSNAEPLSEVVVQDPLPQISLGRSILTKSMKYMVQALLEAIKTGKPDHRLCTLEQQATDLKLFELFK